MTYRVTKTYDHSLGLSACFRQHRAKSHCRFLHGYALAFRFAFEADTLDENGWVIDFGSLKPLKAWLCETFDHKLLIARDDPYRQELIALHTHPANFPDRMLADTLVLEAIGCEAFARLAWDAALRLLSGVVQNDWEVTGVITPDNNRVRLVEVECREHPGNGASYMGGL